MYINFKDILSLNSRSFKEIQGGNVYKFQGYSTYDACLP